MEERSNDRGFGRYDRAVVGVVFTLIATLVAQHIQLAHEDRREMHREQRDAAVGFLAAVVRETGTAGEGLRMIRTASVAEGKVYLERLRADTEAMQAASARLAMVATVRHEIAMCRLMNSMNAYMEAMLLAVVPSNMDAVKKLSEASAKFESAKIAFSYAVKD